MCQTATHPQACDDEPGHKGACQGCPFNEGMTDEADMAQGYGCLPSGYDIIQMKKASGHNWACHSDENKVCAGLCHQAKDKNLNLAEGNLIRYSSWFHAGEEAALEEAQTGVLVQEMTGHYFAQALDGNRYADGTRQEPSIAKPELKYYHNTPARVQPYDKNKDKTRFWVATTPPEKDAESGIMLRRAVGLLELQTSPLDENVTWLMYVSVDPAFERRGIAKRLLDGLVKHLKKTGKRLERIGPANEGRDKLQHYLDRLLDEQGIAWTQSNC